MSLWRVLLVAALFVPAYGQPVSPAFRAKSMDLATDADFAAYRDRDAAAGAPGVQVWLEKMKPSGQWARVSPDSVFFTGDIIRFAIETNFEAAITLLNIDGKLAPKQLIPDRGAADNRFLPGYAETTKGFVFEGDPGDELLLFIVTKSGPEAVAAPWPAGLPAGSPRQPATKPATKVSPSQPGKAPIDLLEYSKQNHAKGAKGGDDEDFVSVSSSTNLTLLARRDNAFSEPVFLTLKVRHKAR